MHTDWSSGRSDEQGHEGADPGTAADGDWAPGHGVGTSAPDAAAVLDDARSIDVAIVSDAGEMVSESAGEEDAHRSAVDAVDGLLDEVERALARLDDGTYGRCQTCGSPIDDSDLAARPLMCECGGCTAGVLVIEGA